MRNRRHQAKLRLACGGAGRGRDRENAPDGKEVGTGAGSQSSEGGCGADGEDKVGVGGGAMGAELLRLRHQLNWPSCLKPPQVTIMGEIDLKAGQLVDYSWLL